MTEPITEGDAAVSIQADARHLPLADASVDLIVTSPPYLALRHYGDDDRELGRTPDVTAYVRDLLDCTAEMARVLKPTGNIFVNLGDRYSNRTIVRASSHRTYLGHDSESLRTPWRQARADGRAFMSCEFGVAEKSLCNAPARFAIGCTDELGLLHRAEIIWHKPNGIGDPTNAVGAGRDRVARSHEVWLHFAKQARHYGDRNGLGSVWTVPVASGTAGHSATFPAEFPARIVAGWSPPSGVVLDPFGGSGTVAREAVRLGRVGISIDLYDAHARLVAA